jgi:Bacterial Ig domain/PKD domain
VGAAIALADSPATSPAVKALAETPDAQVGPAIAVNPAGGSPNIAAVALGTDWRGGSNNPQSVFATGSIVGATGATTWASTTILPHTSGSDTGGGSPDVAWGPGNKVYAIEQGRDAGAPTDPCAAAGGAGLYLFVSSNGGATWGAPLQLINNKPTVRATEPSIAYNSVTGRIYVAYTNLNPCSGGAGSTSTVQLVTLTNDNGTGGTPITPVSGSGLFFGHPSIAVLPNGRVGISYYDSTQSPGSVVVTTCGPPSTGAITAVPSCNRDTPWVVDPSASPPGNTILGLSVDVRPRIAADSTGRVIVTWAKQMPTTNMDVFTATSRDAGLTFGPPQPVPADPGGTANQIDPTVAIAAGGRADVAFLDTRWDSTAFRVAVSASNTPIGFGTSESWTPSVYVESTPIAPVKPTASGTPSLGGKIAIAEIPRTPDTTWTLIAWTDTRNVSVGNALNEDVYSTVLLHGTTAPVASNSTANVQRNMPTIVPINATDADADPLTYSIVQDGTIGHATISDPNRPQFTYTGTKLGTDQVKVLISDGIQTATATVMLLVVNSPPVITCTSLSTPVDKPLPIPASCATDPNGDTVTLDASAPQHGEIQRPGGVLTFVPTTGYEGPAQVTLVASDGIDSATQTVNIQVGDPGQTPVIIAGVKPRAAFTNRPITLTATPTVSGADASKISWSFDGAPPTDQGPTVAHLFSKARTYTVTARVGNGPADTITVYAQKPLLSLKSTDLARGVMGLRVQLSKPGKLTVGLLGIPGPHRTVKLKSGTHTLHMKLPLSARTRGTVIVKLSLKVANGAKAKMKRAVLLPAP